MSDKLIESNQEIYDHLKFLKDAGIKPPEPIGLARERLARHLNMIPLPHLAVDICMHFYAKTFQEALDEGKSINFSEKQAKRVYSMLMPKLSGANNIREFIACVANAMSLDIFPGQEGTRLLFAAQVAHTALTKRPKKRNKTTHTSTAPSSPTPPIQQVKL